MDTGDDGFAEEAAAPEASYMTTRESTNAIANRPLSEPLSTPMAVAKATTCNAGQAASLGRLAKAHWLPSEVGVLEAKLAASAHVYAETQVGSLP